MVKEIIVKSVLNKHRKRDSWFLDDYSVNPYNFAPTTAFTAILEEASMEKIWKRNWL